ncbi:hypothetical protein J21TS7_46470 [Paenibacillus cineris]|uniref:Uncharacterized protein n=1 Tax=Paenibacillus cineris TaxID=237530 RepID=A0ABQ4LIH5_9BACL|nr:hypothetical protein J21TS7_46470 [Paenibacillus cineris]
MKLYFYNISHIVYKCNRKLYRPPDLYKCAKAPFHTEGFYDKSWFLSLVHVTFWDEITDILNSAAPNGLY